MAKKIFKRWLPDPAEIKNRPALNFLGRFLHDPNLFHLNRHSVSGAVFVGLFVAFIPTIGQMPIAACFALLFRVNLPMAVALVWITNPLTMPPVYFVCYEVGRWVMGMPPAPFAMEFTTEWFTSQIAHVWKPFLLGSLLLGITLGGLGYIAVQLFWRFHVIKNWNKRKLRRPFIHQDVNGSESEPQHTDSRPGGQSDHKPANTPDNQPDDKP